MQRTTKYLGIEQGTGALRKKYFMHASNAVAKAADETYALMQKTQAIRKQNEAIDRALNQEYSE